MEEELRNIFALADQDCSGFIDANELLALGKAVNPSFTRQKCHEACTHARTHAPARMHARNARNAHNATQGIQRNATPHNARQRNTAQRNTPSHMGSCGESHSSAVGRLWGRLWVGVSSIDSARRK